MAIIIPDGFEIQSGVPVDKRFRFATIVARNALDSVVRYKGLISYVEETEELYYLAEGITNGDWKPLGVTMAEVKSTSIVNALIFG